MHQPCFRFVSKQGLLQWSLLSSNLCPCTHCSNHLQRPWGWDWGTGRNMGFTPATNVFRGMKFEDFEAININHLQKENHLNHPGSSIVFHANFPTSNYMKKGSVTSFVHWTLLYTCWCHKVKFWRPGKSKGRPQVVGFWHLTPRPFRGPGRKVSALWLDPEPARPGKESFLADLNRSLKLKEHMWLHTVWHHGLFMIVVLFWFYIFTYNMHLDEFNSVTYTGHIY